jgi:hypothetical protein
MVKSNWLRAVVPMLAIGCESDINLFNDVPPPPVPNHPDIENPTQTDVIVQVTTPTVDILWTIGQFVLDVRTSRNA